MRFYCTYCLCICCIISTAVSNDGMVRCSSFIDTNDIRTGPAVSTWIRYLNSSPDSIQENPLWPMKDRNDRFSFDPARVWIFQSKEFMNTFPPMIIGAEEVQKGKVLIKTLFQGMDSTGSNLPIAVYRVLARVEDGQWQLESVLETMTEDWNTKSIGGMTFYMSPQHKYSSSLARKAMRFCDSLTALFDLGDIEDTRYYVTSSKDELASILGFDFFVSTPQGLTYPEKDWVFTALDTELHSHELVHLMFRSFSNTHPFISEGLSTWLGGSLGENLRDLKKQLAIEYVRRPNDLSIEKVLEKGQRESLAYYTFGAMICRQVFLLRGGSGLKKFLNDCAVETSKLHEIISHHLSIQINEIDPFLRTGLFDAHTVGSD